MRSVSFALALAAMTAAPAFVAPAHAQAEGPVATEGQFELAMLQRGDRRGDRNVRRDRSDRQRGSADYPARRPEARTGDRRDGDRNWGDRNNRRDTSDRRDQRDWGQRRDQRDWNARRDQRDWNRRQDRRDWNDRRDQRSWGQRDRSWNTGWRNDRRYDWRGYRNNYRHIYRPGRYYAPYRGYNYRRFNAGLTIGPAFFGSRYWINDPWQYRLPPAYGPYRWIRYYDDVLLIDTRSGYVMDVIYDFFW